MKRLLIFLMVFSLHTLAGALFAQNLGAEEVVQANLDAYNNRDIETFMSYISEDIEMYNSGECEPYLKGKALVKERYKTYFEASPELHSEIKNRMVFGNKVIDYEFITGSNGKSEPYELIFMYEVEAGKIIKTTAIRK